MGSTLLSLTSTELSPIPIDLVRVISLLFTRGGHSGTEGGGGGGGGGGAHPRCVFRGRRGLF